MEGAGGWRTAKEKGEESLRMIGRCSHPWALGTNIRLGGIYSYKLSAAAVVSSQEGARRGGFVSIKGIEVLSCFTSVLFYCFSVSSRRSTLCPLKFFPSLVHSLNPP